MKNNLFTAIGLMSGTSMDGVDSSLISSDGHSKFSKITDKYFKFDKKLYSKLVHLRNLIKNKDDLLIYSKDLLELERELTLFHVKVVNEIMNNYLDKVDLIGFHGQTIYHNSNEKISRQIGNGKLLSQLTKTKVVFDFRQEDIINGGQGAPLSPVFHNVIAKILNIKNKISYPMCFLNIGGISNITIINKNKDNNENDLKAFDIGPGNCLIDKWIIKNSNLRYDNNGFIGKSGVVDELILNQAIENFRINSFDNALDINDFDISFAKGLSLENGCATITNFTAYLIAKGIEYANSFNKKIQTTYFISGGGRKNVFLIENIKKNLSNYRNIKIEIIDDYSFDGDFLESQAFGYLAIRSYLKLPISFPQTTGCKIPSTGGKIINN